ncbi:protein FAM13A [Cylas formicarius]|uniref:protein FAM13A n=1 Tax=Cylas formicarius TaxID=197179 RepID=UPI002958D0E6|nr:protein FAM13A [Cylas formicarius]
MKGPSRREEQPQKFVARIDYDHKICKVKKITLPVANKQPSVTTTTFDEFKASCKARKRKERQESISSLCQERKVIRSNSEERPVHNKSVETRTNIRRVSSSGDFPKSASIEKISVSPNRIPTCEKWLTYDDGEYEKRRSHERFAKPHTIKNKRQPSKRLRMRYNTKVKIKAETINEKDYGKRFSLTHNQGTFPYLCSMAAEHPKDHEGKKSPNHLNLGEHEAEPTHSPNHTPVSPVLDFSTLYEQVDCSEPVLSSTTRHVNENMETLPSLAIATNRSLSSPRNSIIATHKIYLDPDIPHMNVSLEKLPQSPMQRLHKQINSIKKKIKNYETEFETARGFKPSQIDKLNDSCLRKLYGELSKLKKEEKQRLELPESGSMIDFDEATCERGRKFSLQDTVNEIQQKLAQKRESGKRSIKLEEMTSDQLVEEKVSMQKALLYLESVHGRAQSKEDRDVVRPFYDRYRTLKRMVAKLSIANTTVTELATIDENEAMHFITPTSSSYDTESEKTENPRHIVKAPSNSSDSDTESSFSENFHSLSKAELAEQLKIVVEEKKQLRRTIKEFEIDVQAKTGRMLTREDKVPIENVYMAYKKAKGKLRLIEALIGKP